MEGGDGGGDNSVIQVRLMRSDYGRGRRLERFVDLLVVWSKWWNVVVINQFVRLTRLQFHGCICIGILTITFGQLLRIWDVHVDAGVVEDVAQRVAASERLSLVLVVARNTHSWVCLSLLSFAARLHIGLLSGRLPIGSILAANADVQAGHVGEHVGVVGLEADRMSCSAGASAGQVSSVVAEHLEQSTEGSQFDSD